jgi:protein TonB
LSLRIAILFSAVVHLFFFVVLLRGEFLLKTGYTPTPLVARIIIPEEKPHPIKETTPPREKIKQLHKVPQKRPKRKPGSLAHPPKPKIQESAPVKKSPEMKTVVPEKPVKKEIPEIETEKEIEDKTTGLEAPPSISKEGQTVKPGPAPPVIPSGRQLLDKGIIEKMARKSLKQMQKPSTGLTFDASELKYKPYLQRLKDRIESIWIYPPDAAVRGIYGDLYIRFTIKKDGHLGEVELLRTSGYRELDEAALQALRDGEPYWPLPDSWGMDSITITGHFIYTIYGIYIR